MENVCGMMYKCMYVVKEIEKRNKSMETLWRLHGEGICVGGHKLGAGVI